MAKKFQNPEWLTLFYVIAALGACAALLSALLLAHRPHQQESGSDVVADLTVNLGGQPVREHCTTCHIDGGRPYWLNPEAAAHPDISPHTIEELGCTGCHLGEGMALDVKISHGLPGLGARKVIPGKDTQARCYVCHELSPLTGAEKAWRGYEIFRKKGCDLCHHLDGLQGSGRFGPALSHIGSQLGLEQLQEAIRDPKQKPANSTMPRFPLSRSQVRDLSYFLKSRVDKPLYATPMQIRSGSITLPDVTLVPIEISSTEPLAVLYEARCLACHQYRTVDGRIAPDLTYIGSMRDREYLLDSIRAPSRRIPGSTMPAVNLDDRSEIDLLDYLQKQAIGPLAEPTDHMMEQMGARESEAKYLYMQLCQRCHAANGDGKGLIQANLVNFPRAFTDNSAFFKRADDQRLQKSLADGINGTSMPPYGKLLSESQRNDLLDLIFASFIGVDRLTKDTLQELPSQPDHGLSTGTVDALYADLCQRCHGLTGTGKGPDSLAHLPRPRDLTNTHYFSLLADKRITEAIFHGIPGTAMPAWGSQLDSAEIWGLVGKVRHLSEPRHD